MAEFSQKWGRMTWQTIFIVAVLLGIMGVPVLFFHPIGWGMLFGGAWLAYMSGEKALTASSLNRLRKAVKPSLYPGEFSDAEPNRKFDPASARLEQLGFSRMGDVRIVSEKNAAVRLMRNQEGQVWAILRRNFGTTATTLYAFAVNGGVIRMSNTAFSFEYVPVTARTVHQKYPGKNLNALYGLMINQLDKLAYEFPTGLETPILRLQTPAEFIQKLDEFNLRFYLAPICYDRQMLLEQELAPGQIDHLLKLQAINRNEYWEYLPSAPALRLTAQNESAVRSHLGGLPELPPGEEWPATPNGYPMNFIARIDCAEIVADDSLPALPRHGVLSFFYALEDDEGYFGTKPGDNCAWRVLYRKCPEGLERRNAPEKLHVFKESPIAAVPALTRLGGHGGFLPEQTEPYHQMFGYPDYLQNPLMPEKCAEMTKTQFPSRPEDWVLLLQIDSNCSNSDLLFGDTGMLYFWILREDLARCRFDRVWLLMECC